MDDPMAHEPHSVRRLLAIGIRFNHPSQYHELLLPNRSVLGSAAPALCRTGHTARAQTGIHKKEVRGTGVIEKGDGLAVPQLAE